MPRRIVVNRYRLSSEAIAILEDAMRDRSHPPTLEQIDRVRVLGRRPLRQVIVDRALTRKR